MPRHGTLGHRGVALPMAVFALLVIGVLVGAAFVFGWQEELVGRSTIRSRQAFDAAEAGVHVQLEAWDAARANQLPAGDSIVFDGSVAGAGWYRGSLRRLNDLLFLVRAEGFSADSGARRQLGMVVRLQPVEFTPVAALRTLSVVDISGSSFIDGHDRSPDGWAGCAAPGPPLPGIQLPAIEDLLAGSCADLHCVAGNPPAEEHPLTAESLAVVGGSPVDDLRRLATKTLPGGVRDIHPTVAGGVCDVSDPNNLGSPLQPTEACGGYFPIAWSDGALTITSGQGQGILVVDGDLTVQGGFEHAGLVIVLGVLRAAGGGGHFRGGVIARGVELAQDELTGSAVIAYSSCALGRTLRSAALGAPLRSRGWAFLY